MSSLCPFRSPLWVQAAAELPLPLASGNNMLCVLVIAPEPVGSAHSWKQSSVCCGWWEYSVGVFPLTATEMSACTVQACWLGLTSDYVFSGCGLNYQFLSARNLLNDSAHPRLLTGESNTLVGNRMFGEASNGLTFQPVSTAG